jgi:hypothetical protein
MLLLFIAAAIGYLYLVRRLRLQRMNAILEKYRQYYHDGKSLGQMTLEDAFAIQIPLAELEFPTTFSVSIFFALFKVYIIIQP